MAIIYEEDEIRTLAGMCDNRTEFAKAYKAAYNQAKSKDMIDEMFPSLNTKEGQIRNGLIKIGSKYKNRSEMQDKNRSAYNMAKKMDMLDKIFPSYDDHFSEANIRELASKFNSIEEFELKEAAAFYKAKMLGIENKLF